MKLNMIMFHFWISKLNEETSAICPVASEKSQPGVWNFVWFWRKRSPWGVGPGPIPAPRPARFSGAEKRGARTGPVKNVWGDVELGHRWGFHRWGYPYSWMVIANWGISPCITFRLPTNPLKILDDVLKANASGSRLGWIVIGGCSSMMFLPFPWFQG